MKLIYSGKPKEFTPELERKVEAKLAKQEKDFTARFKEQDAKIQQVSDELEVSKSAPQTVLNNQ